MNRTLASTLIAASAALSGHALAESPTPEASFVSTADRAQVQAEWLQNRRGANRWSNTYNPLARFKGELSREQVRTATSRRGTKWTR